MKIEIKNNKIYCNYFGKAYANITNNRFYATIEIIKVDPQFRGKKIATALLSSIIKYIRQNIKNIKMIVLSPLPLDSNGLKIEQLVNFYKRYNFSPINNPPIHSPYMMSLKLI
ncbi:MAG: GNAT family N-acetyltransferase [Campylobacterota bacterium]|nr:GNAT family N-acetyltransferase [Campylobacterota bacterium]